MFAPTCEHTNFPINETRTRRAGRWATAQKGQMMPQDPIRQAQYFIDNGLPKSPKRVAEIRKRFVKLMFDSHEYGAGGVMDSDRYKTYQRVANMCANRSISNAKKAAGDK